MFLEALELYTSRSQALLKYCYINAFKTIRDINQLQIS